MSIDVNRFKFLKWHEAKIWLGLSWQGRFGIHSLALFRDVELLLCLSTRFHKIPWFHTSSIPWPETVMDKPPTFFFYGLAWRASRCHIKTTKRPTSKKRIPIRMAERPQEMRGQVGDETTEKKTPTVFISLAQKCSKGSNLKSHHS